MKTSFLRIFLFVLIITGSWSVASQPKPKILKPSNRQFTYRMYQLPGPRIELGLNAGAVYPLTDVAPGEPDLQPSFKDFRFESVDLNGGLFMRYRFNNLYSVRGTASFLKIKGHDKWAATDTVRQRRRGFTNELYELAAIGEFNLSKKGRFDIQDSWVDFIFFAGAGVVYHDPVVEGIIYGPDGPDPYDEAQRNDPLAYKNIAMVFPTGIMIQYSYLNNWAVGLDLNFRWTFTDFLDGFDRPTKQRPDYFFTTNLSFSYILNSAPQKANGTVFRRIFKKKRSHAGEKIWM